MFVPQILFCVCCGCVGKGLCDELITRSEKCYWKCMCVSNCVQSRNLNDEAVQVRVGLLCSKKKKKVIARSEGANFPWVEQP